MYEIFVILKNILKKKGGYIDDMVTLGWPVFTKKPLGNASKTSVCAPGKWTAFFGIPHSMIRLEKVPFEYGSRFVALFNRVLLVLCSLSMCTSKYFTTSGFTIQSLALINFRGTC